VTGWTPAEIRALDELELATALAVLDERARK
jgi:hypothetical protein